MTNKIAYLFAPGPFGGAEQIVLQAIKHIPNIKLWLIKETRNPKPCLDFINYCKENNIAYSIFECQGQFDFGLLKNLKNRIKKEGIQIIHSHGMKANFYNGFLNVARVATQHGKTSHNFKVKILEYIEHLVLKRMNRVICVSQAMFDQSPYKNKILIPNFLSLNFSKKAYTNDGVLSLLFIGRLSPEKGLDNLLQALEMSSKVILNVLGDGPQLDQYRKGEYSFTVNFLGFQREISHFIEKADALIMPSIREGLPMTLIEATASGLPILASNVGGIPTLVKDNGLLFNPHDQKDIIRKIEIMQDNRKTINESAILFSEKVKEEYSLEKWIVRTNQIYNSF